MAASPPIGEYQGQIWFNSENVKTFVWYDNYWIEIASSSYANVYIREAITANTSSLANNASQALTVTGYKSYSLTKIYTSHACWVRLYTTLADQQADINRPITENAGLGIGIVAEVVSTGAGTINLAPIATGANNETPVSTNMYVTITNLSGAPASITAIMTVLRLEI